MSCLPEASKLRLIQALSLVCAMVCGSVVALATEPSQNSKGADESPLYKEYRGISIGMSTEEARKKLGNPADKGDEQDFFIFNDNETAQIVYDKSRKIIAISVDFMNGARDVPTPQVVFGSDIEAKPDGSMYRLVRYPKAGYWLSYNRTSGNSPLTTVTMQKIEP